MRHYQEIEKNIQIFIEEYKKNYGNKQNKLRNKSSHSGLVRNLSLTSLDSYFSSSKDDVFTEFLTSKSKSESDLFALKLKSSQLDVDEISSYISIDFLEENRTKMNRNSEKNDETFSLKKILHEGISSIEEFFVNKIKTSKEPSNISTNSSRSSSLFQASNKEQSSLNICNPINQTQDEKRLVLTNQDSVFKSNFEQKKKGQCQLFRY
ncbi:unnamed protein product [Brachionus calyciflorus]|uniref:Uncharacterized protein n=1 Tax=Brachionus calyciflorus TaxID=104777 RepID=A0A813PKZ4_9BILA|nr:unnamed protein product [Brachionus calyciflorus]